MSTNLKVIVDEQTMTRLREHFGKCVDEIVSQRAGEPP